MYTTLATASTTGCQNRYCLAHINSWSIKRNNDWRSWTTKVLWSMKNILPSLARPQGYLLNLFTALSYHFRSSFCAGKTLSEIWVFLAAHTSIEQDFQLQMCSLTILQKNPWQYVWEHSLGGKFVVEYYSGNAAVVGWDILAAGAQQRHCLAGLSGATGVISTPTLTTPPITAINASTHNEGFLVPPAWAAAITGHHVRCGEGKRERIERGMTDRIDNNALQ